MGQPAARLGDPGVHVSGAGKILDGCTTVRIEGRLAVRRGDKVQHNSHPEVITTGEPTVRIGGAGLLAARTGDKMSCKGCVGPGSSTVRIGLTAEGHCLQTASDNGAAYVQPADTTPAHGRGLPPTQ